MPWRPDRRVPGALLMIVALVLACGDTTTNLTHPVITTVTVTPATSSLTAVGATVQLSAQTLDSDGTTVAGASVTWSSSATSVASVAAGGLVTAVASGAATITATSGTVTGSASVTVDIPPAPVDSVDVSPDSDTLTSVGATVQMTATIFDSTGTVLTGRTVDWTTSDSLVASVDAAGLVGAVGDGAVWIVATVESVSDSASIVVSLPVPAPPRLAFAREDTVTNDLQLWLLDPDTDTDTLVVVGDVGEFAMSPDQQRVLFDSEQDTSGWNMLHIPTGSVTPVFNCGEDCETATWSPSGDRIAIDFDDTILLVDTAGAPIDSLTLRWPGGVTPSEWSVTEISWSGGGNEIAMRCSGPMEEDLCILDLATDSVRFVSVTSASVSNPVWSPDGAWIAFKGGASNEEIMKVRPDGTGEVAVVSQGAYTRIEVPTWSPDSAELAFECRDPVDREDYICFVDATGGAIRQSVLGENPRWGN